MAKISNYSQDTDVTKNDKFLGSDSGGSTKNFSLESVSDFFKTTNAAGIVGQYVWQYKTTTPTNGQVKPTFSSGSTFTNLTSLLVSEVMYGGSNSIENILATLENQDIIIVDTANQNNFGIFTADTIVAVGGSNNHTITLTNKRSANGSFVADKYYSLMIFPGIGRTFTHHQNSASTTWTINHNLGKYPSVSLKFSSSDNVYTNVGAFAGVTYTNDNTITITLAASESGYAYLN